VDCIVYNHQPFSLVNTMICNSPRYSRKKRLDTFNAVHLLLNMMQLVVLHMLIYLLLFRRRTKPLNCHILTLTILFGPFILSQTSRMITSTEEADGFLD
jgi:hypothetical protein